MNGVNAIRAASNGPGAPPPRGGPYGRPAMDEALLATPILIIEDEAVIAWTLESLFEDVGFATITLAPTAADAIAAAALLRPGLIVSDVNLGGGPDGIDATAAIVASTAAPAIFVTGYADDDTRLRIDRRVPGAPVLRKPVQAGDLLATVHAMLHVGRAN